MFGWVTVHVASTWGGVGVDLTSVALLLRKLFSFCVGSIDRSPVRLVGVRSAITLSIGVDSSACTGSVARVGIGRSRCVSRFYPFRFIKLTSMVHFTCLRLFVLAASVLFVAVVVQGPWPVC